MSEKGKKRKATINQHYVPKFYLKNFLNASKEVWAFDKANQRTFSKSPKAIASENFFYDLPEFDEQFEERQVVETYLGKIENLHAPFFKRLIEAIDNNEVDEIDSDIRSILADHLVIQILRTKEHRETMSQSHNGFRDVILSSGWIPKGHQEAFSSLFSEQHVKKNHLEEIMLDTDFKNRLYNILDAHIWIIFKNMTGLPYYTSDNPVVKYAHVVREHRSDTGFASPGIEIVHPISPRHLLVLLERTHHKDHAKYNNHIAYERDVQRVIFYNSLQVIQSYKTVFCNENQFDLAKEMVVADPELANVNRQRIGFAQ